jgi:putative MATE family efflux protein
MNDKYKTMSHFETDSIVKLLFKYSTPSILALLAMASYELIDRIFIGRFVGDTGLAVLGVGFPFIMLLSSACLMIRVGASSAFSRRLGRGDIESCKKILGNTFLASVACSFALLIFGVVFADFIVRLCGATETIADDAAQYVQIIALGTPFFFITFIGNSIMRASGAPGQGLFVVVLFSAVNIILDAIFIIYFGWGVPGAAWATVFSGITGAVYVFGYFLKGKSLIRLKRESFTFCLKLSKEITSVGFAYALFHISFIAIAAISLNMLSKYGDAVSLAQIAIINSCMAFLYMPVTGLDEGMQPVIGYNFGAKNKERVKKIVLWALAIGIIFFSFVFFIIYFGAELIVSIFIADNPEFEEMTARVLRISFAVAPLLAIMIIVPGILSALGEVKSNVILNIGIQICVHVPLLFILPRFWGTDGVWISFPIVDTISVLGLILLYKALKRHGILD